MNIKRIEELIEVIEDANVTELAVKCDGSGVTVRKSGNRAKPVPPPQPPERSAPEAEHPSETAAPAGHVVPAPMVGIFHMVNGLKSSGAKVRRGQVLGAIESMKLMNDVVSEEDGVLAEIYVEDGTPVEYGQALFRLDGVTRHS